MQKSFEDLIISQAYYADKFLQNSEFLASKGFYKRLAKFVQEVNMEDDSIIIDAGCADCKLIHSLREIYQKLTIIGVDINTLLIMVGQDMLTKLGHEVNFHRGINVAKDPSDGRTTLISDIITKNIPFNFRKGVINILQEDLRFGDVLIERVKKDFQSVDMIIYSIPGGFSPHKIFEEGEESYNSVRSGLELNEHILILGLGLLKDNGKMIWAVRVGAKDINTLKDMSLKDMHLSQFDSYYEINRREIVLIDEKEQNLELPAYNLGKNVIHYNRDIRNTKNIKNFNIAILFLEMTKKRSNLSDSS